MERNKTDELNELFNKWIENQKNKIEIGNGIRLNKSFTKDGIICEEEYKNPKILFILKEPNILKQITEESYKDDQKEFYRNFFNSAFFEKDKDNVLKPTQKEEIKCKEKSKRYLYYFDNIPVKQKEKIARMAEYIIDGKITDNYDDLKNALKQVAFMNLNKSGGAADSDKNYFLSYCEEFSSNICKEIEIIDPEIIVLIGAKSYKNGDKYLLNDEIVKSLFYKRRVIDVVHTAARGQALNINDEEKEILKQKFMDKYNDNLDVMYNNIVKIDKSKLHMKHDRGVFKFFLKFVAAYEKNEQKISKEGNL